MALPPVQLSRRAVIVGPRLEARPLLLSVGHWHFSGSDGKGAEANELNDVTGRLCGDRPGLPRGEALCIFLRLPSWWSTLNVLMEGSPDLCGGSEAYSNT